LHVRRSPARDGFQGCCQFLLAEQIALRLPLAIRLGEDPLSLRMTTENTLLVIDPPLHNRTDNFSILRQRNCLIEQTFEWNFPEPPMRLLHARHEARHQSRASAFAGNRTR